MTNKGQDQNVAEGSTAIQAGGSITITKTGQSYAEVRDVALDVFRANFYELAGLAKDTAKARAGEITEAFLNKLQKEHPNGFEKAQDPDFQYALFTVQKEYARHGDKDLGDLLVDLLVDRSKQQDRDILQIVLNESLSTAPKLTENQLAVLAVIFLFKYTQQLNVGNHEKLGEYLDKHVYPFVSKLVKNMACYQHLEFSGCGAVGLGEHSLESILSATYQGLFLKGFDEKEVANHGVSIGLDPKFFMPCLNDGSKLQVRATNKQMLDKAFEAYSVTADDRNKISALFDAAKMNDVEVKAKCIEIRPFMSQLFDVWSESVMKNFTLTSVGIAIGHANIKRLVGEFANLAIWIN
ncbi:MAG: LPO_1073/Vpar_1526 family protein [Candidatus Binatia bacterium]